MLQSVTILIPTCDRPKELKKTLRTLSRVVEEPFLHKVLVINNSFTKIPQKWAKHKRVIIKNYYPLNLLESKNKALSQIKSKWVLVLDDDLLFDPNVVKKFVDYSKKYKFNVATGLLKEKNRYKIFDFLNFSTYGKLTFYKVACLNTHKILSNKPHYIDFAPGGFMFAKTSILKKIKYDTNYLFPFYNEDTHLTLNAKKVMFFPKIKALHLKAKKGGNRNISNLKDWYYAFGFNNSYFVNKNFSGFYYFLYSVFRARDHLHVLKKPNLSLLLTYIKGIYYGYIKAKNKN
ncbi:hypothetical protein COV24_04930 [candidate division WWE3 bacterium CG10_big_fil_rev_8_21_14_0_10_32_10]|uniref:Glycosyltransferase 2-like domain-containing protein n=1 Tax=candidate division WWE3 bacterium CG10_big_fil_rev_8_21_14_0_10_32_10 TaxID=1975090 RepID=A0A2H0R909_UNCKA|nr:MAG: hypothetical protein COV24_04930 [candidate division WWE3 bacterium CG10_big_fil_rev_8_21_14_0_10_32_10]